MHVAPSIKWTLRAATALLLVSLSWLASAQEKYPSRPIEFIVPWGPGGGADQLARKAAKLMEEDLKVSLPVVNSPGAWRNCWRARPTVIRFRS